MKTQIMICLAVEIPDGYWMELTSESIDGGGYLYTGHLHDRGPKRPWREPITFDLSNITSECQRAVANRIHSAIAKAT